MKDDIKNPQREGGFGGSSDQTRKDEQQRKDRQNTQARDTFAKGTESPKWDERNPQSGSKTGGTDPKSPRQGNVR